MKRRIVHRVFAGLAAASLVLAALDGWRLHRGLQVNAAVARAALPAAAQGELPPQALLARAVASAQAGDGDAALRDYKALIQSGPRALRLAALYDVGNLHLRAALKDGPERSARSAPLIELAKQSYRDLLRDDPADWDARYNLERALQLAPEAEEPDNEDLSTPPTRERSISTLQGARIDLP